IYGRFERCNIIKRARLPVTGSLIPLFAGKMIPVATQGAWRRSLTRAKPLPPSPCSGRPSARGGGGIPELIFAHALSRFRLAEFPHLDFAGLLANAPKVPDRKSTRL